MPLKLINPPVLGCPGLILCSLITQASLVAKLLLSLHVFETGYALT